MPKVVDTDRRRDEIHRAVAALAVDDGFGAVTLRSVAARLGGSTTTVTHYFPTRDELVASTIRRELDRFAAAADAALAASVRASASARERIRGFVEFAVFGAPGDLRAFWMRLVVESRTDPLLRTGLERFDRFWDARLTALVAELDLDGGRAELLVSWIDLVVSGAVMLGFEGVAEPERRASSGLLLDAILREIDPAR